MIYSKDYYFSLGITFCTQCKNPFFIKDRVVFNKKSFCDRKCKITYQKINESGE